MNQLAWLLFVTYFALPTVVAQEPKATETEGKALIVIYRPNRFTGKTLTPSVYVDEVEVARLANGRYFSVYVEAGKHEVRSSMKKHPPVEIEVETGEVVYLEMVILPGVRRGGGRMVPATVGGAMAEIIKLKPLDKKWVRDRRVGFEFERKEVQKNNAPEEPLAIPTEEGVHVLKVKSKVTQVTFSAFGKVTEKNALFYRIAWQVTVLNNTNQTKKFDLQIQFLDSDKFIIDEDQKYNVLLRAGDQRIISGFSMVTTRSPRQVKSVQATIASTEQ